MSHNTKIYYIFNKQIVDVLLTNPVMMNIIKNMYILSFALDDLLGKLRSFSL